MFSTTAVDTSFFFPLILPSFFVAPGKSLEARSLPATCALRETKPQRHVKNRQRHTLAAREGRCPAAGSWAGR